MQKLKGELRRELSGDFERLMLALLTPWEYYIAEEIHDAVDGAGTNEKKLIEILCSSTNQEIRRITAAYEQLHSKGIEAAIKGDVSGDFKRLLICLLQVLDQPLLKSPITAIMNPNPCRPNAVRKRYTYQRKRLLKTPTDC